MSCHSLTADRRTTRPGATVDWSNTCYGACCHPDVRWRQVPHRGCKSLRQCGSLVSDAYDLRSIFTKKHHRLWFTPPFLSVALENGGACGRIKQVWLICFFTQKLYSETHQIRHESQIRLHSRLSGPPLLRYVCVVPLRQIRHEAHIHLRCFCSIVIGCFARHNV